jgi:hypothetical protein
MSRRSSRPAVAAVVLAAHSVLTALVWRDIDRRTAAELRGSKTFWKLVTALNTGNHLLYLMIGRRRPS